MSRYAREESNNIVVMSIILSWADVDVRWPDASVMWDLEVASEGWAPRLHAPLCVLLADNPHCARRHDAWRDQGACNCRVWNGEHWITRDRFRSPGWSRLVLNMSSGVNILPNMSAQITGRPPHVPFRPERIIIGGTPRDWIVNDIRIGRRSQFSQSGDVPGEFFASTGIGSFVSFETVQVAMDFVMLVTHVGSEETGALFVCSVFGSSLA